VTEEREHSRTSPSGADRWAVCTASLDFCESRGLVSKDTPAGLRGTSAHALLEHSLKTGKPPQMFKGRKFGSFVADSEMVDAVDLALDYIMQFLTGTAKLYTELEVPIAEIDGGGHVDVALADRDVLHVFDYKNGRHRVSPVENKQMMLYAIGAQRLLKYKGSRVVLHIVQPNANSAVGEAWDTTVVDILKWAEAVVVPAMDEIRGKRGVFRPCDKACHWCPGKGECKARAMDVIQTTRADFLPTHAIKGSITASMTEQLTPADLAYVLTRRKAVADWLKSVEVAASRLASASKLPGYKLVAGKGGRAWNENADAVLAPLGPERFADPKLRGVVAVEKLAKQKGKSALIARATKYREGRPQLAPKDDPRRALQGNAALDFSDFINSSEDD
jgi:hypothetical protein